MIIIADEIVISTHDCRICTNTSCVQVFEDGYIHDIRFDDEKIVKTVFQLIKEEVKRQLSSCPCEIVIDISEIRERIKTKGDKHERT